MNDNDPDNVPSVWRVGDVILDRYEVKNNGRLSLAQAKPIVLCAVPDKALEKKARDRCQTAAEMLAAPQKALA